LFEPVTDPVIIRVPVAKAPFVLPNIGILVDVDAKDAVEVNEVIVQLSADPVVDDTSILPVAPCSIKLLVAPN